MAEPRSTGLGLRLAYGVGAVAYGVKDNGFNYLLLFYYDQVLGLPASWVGAALLIALVFDAFSDPVVGTLSDNWHSRLGRRHPFMYAAALPVAIAFFLLWNPPDGLSQGQLLAWLIGVAVLVRTLITFFEIPSTAMVSELTHRYDERTALLSFRYFFAWWGGLTMSLLAYWVFFPGGSEGVQGQLAAQGYRAYGWAAACIMLTAMLVSAAGTHHRIPNLKAPPDRARPGLRAIFRELIETLSTGSIRAIFAGALFYGMAAGVSAGLNIYINTYFWGLSAQQIGWLTVAFFGSAAAALLLSPWASARYGKKRAAIGTAILAMSGFPLLIGLYLAGLLPERGSEPLFWLILVVTAVDVTLLICSTTLISAMVADVVEESELRTGRRSEGVFFAARTFAHKSVSGLGLFSASVILGLIEFPKEASVAVDVSDAVLRNLGIAYSIGTVLFYGLAIYCYSLYRIDRAAHVENLRRLAERAAAERA